MRKMKVIVLVGVVAMMCVCAGCGKKDIKNEYIEIENYDEVDIQAGEKCQISEEDIMTYIEEMMCVCAGCGKKDIKNEYIEIENYDEVDIQAGEKCQISEEDIMTYIEEMRQRNAVQKEITDQPVEMGDTVSIDFSGKIDGHKIEESVGKDYTVTVGAGEIVEGFDDNIIGRHIGEKYDFVGKLPEDYYDVEESVGKDYTVTVGAGEIVEGFDDNIIGRHIGEKYDFVGKLPEDYYDVAFAGKKVEFEIKVNTISRPEILPLNNKFVTMVSDKSKTVEEYKKEVKEILEENEQEKVSKEEKIWEAVLEKTRVKNYPEDRLKGYSKELIKNCKESAQSFGMEYEEFLNSEMGMTVDEYEQEAKKTAQNVVKEELILEAISEKEKLVPNQKEYEEEYQKLAQEYGYDSVEELKKEINEKELEFTILKRKVLEWLSQNCKV